MVTSLTVDCFFYFNLCRFVSSCVQSCEEIGIDLNK